MKTNFSKPALNTGKKSHLMFAIHTHICKMHLKRERTFFLKVSSAHLKTLTSAFTQW